ncbi:hypothetical protein SA58113_1994 [Staphylococcus argenteus]|nr:hypothetical protein SA58113_1994 [Staphylococcus argenteus]
MQSNYTLAQKNYTKRRPTQQLQWSCKSSLSEYISS